MECDKKDNSDHRECLICKTSCKNDCCGFICAECNELVCNDCKRNAGNYLYGTNYDRNPICKGCKENLF